MNSTVATPGRRIKPRRSSRQRGSSASPNRRPSDARLGRRVASSVSEHPQAPAPKLLCIDDDPELCRTLEMRLSKYRVDVLLAYFGTQGYWEAITDQPDLILMDVRMPNGDGRFVLQSLRQNKATCSIPVITLTGMRDPKIRHEMLSLGADSYLQKPIRFNALLDEMRRFTEIISVDDSD
ncbi:MAG: response regulator [Planctomycetota bacterium]